MLKSLRPKSTDGLDDETVRKYNAIRMIARGLRLYPLVYQEAVLMADDLMDTLTRRDAQITALEQEIKRLNTVLVSCQRDIEELKRLLGMERGVKP